MFLAVRMPYSLYKTIQTIFMPHHLHFMACFWKYGAGGLKLFSGRATPLLLREVGPLLMKSKCEFPDLSRYLHSKLYERDWAIGRQERL